MNEDTTEASRPPTDAHHWLPWLPAITAVLMTGLFLAIAAPRPASEWAWLDIAGEGGSALMAGLWATIVACTRPGGRVTLWLAGGLTTVMLGALADCLDEVVLVAHSAVPLGWVESTLAPLGMLALTVALWLWRQEQRCLSEHLNKRERLFRDHRAFDRVTQLADAAYLRRQIALEAARPAGSACAVVMLELAGLQRIGREHGPTEARRALQAASHQLLLNLRQGDLLCRYAGSRFVVLMPNTARPAAERRAEHLSRMLAGMRFHTLRDDPPLPLDPHAVCAVAQGDAQALLTTLGAELEAQGAAAHAAGHATAVAST